MPMTKPTSEQVTFLAAGTGAQQRTALDKMRDMVSVKDFGAKGDGVTDDSAAIQAAIDAVSVVGGPELYFPAGNYLCQTGLVLRSNSRICGANTAPIQDRGAYPKSNTRLLFPSSTVAGFKGMFVESLFPSGGALSVMVSIRNISLAGTASDGAISATSVGIDMSAGVVNVKTENVWIDRFGVGLSINAAIRHSHHGLHIQNCATECLRCGPSLNTTTWFTDCTFRQAPWGIVIETALGIHFVNMYLESTTVGGIQVNKGCTVTFTNTYAENVLGTIFRVFKDGASKPFGKGTVCIDGGEIAGGNSVLSDCGIDIGETGRVNIYGATWLRCVDAVRCDLALTQRNTVGVFGCEFLQVTNPFTNSDVATYGMVSGNRVNEAGTPTAKAASFAINRGTGGDSMFVAGHGGTTIQGRFGVEGDGATNVAVIGAIDPTGDAALRLKTTATGSTAERARISPAGYLKASPSGTYTVPNFVTTNAVAAHQLRSDTDGTTTPTLIVSNVNAGANATALVTTKPDATNGFHIRCINAGAPAARMIVAANGDVTNTNNSYTAISDISLKTDIVDAGSQWDDILAIRLRKFTLRDDPAGMRQIGVIAQEVEQVSPGLVASIPKLETVEVERVNDAGETVTELECMDSSETVKSVKYSIMFVKAIGALQEAMRRIEQLESRIAQYEQR